MVNYYSTLTRLEETAGELCEEHGYHEVSRSSSEIVLRRERDDFRRTLKYRPQEY